MSSKWFSIAFFLTLIIGSDLRAAETVKRPNFIFILADDLGWSDLGCYGHFQLKTPNIDRLAKEGTLFTQFYVNGSVCSPSRCAFMTGQYPARHKIHGHYTENQLNAARGMNNWLDPKVPNVAALLQKSGYATAHFGKWHLGSGEGAPPPADYGFDETRTVNANGPNWDEPDLTFRAKSSAAIVDETIRFAIAHTNKPFYVNAWMLIPHATLNPTEEQMEPYEDLQPGREKGLPFKSAAQIYYSSVTDMDKQIGRLLRALDELGLAENTVILFSSDNGPEDIHVSNAGHSGIGSAGPFRGRKRSLYEGGIRVPGIVRWPGNIPAGKIDDKSVVAGVDWLPTVCKLAGIKVPASHKLDGEDVTDIFFGKSRARVAPLFWEWRFKIFGEPFHHSPMLAVREGDWKLLLNPDRSRVELYEIKKDPTQLNNVSEHQPEVVARLSEKVLAWQKELPAGHIDPGAGQMYFPWPTKQK
ncbi:MAG: sulfatase-like hydrolase/transferase [Verrucomicrobiota bacterium]